MKTHLLDRFILVVLIGSGIVYLPTFGVGTVGAPDPVAQALLILPGLVAAGAAAWAIVRGSFIPTRATALLVLSSTWMAITALQGPDAMGGFARGVWFGALALSIAHSTAKLGPLSAFATMVAATGVFVGLGIVLDPVIDARIDALEVVIDRAIFPWPRLRGLGANQAVLGYAGVTTALGAWILRRRFSPPVALVLMGVGVLGVLASHNRSALGLLAVGGVLDALWSRERLAVATAGIGLAALSVLAVATERVDSLDRRSVDVVSIDYYGGSDDGLLTGRSDVWELAIEHGSFRPLSGRGNGSFANYSAEQFEQLSVRWDASHAHNVIVEIFVDQGIVGLLIFGAAILMIVTDRANWMLGTPVLLAVFLGHSLVESVFSGSPTTRWQFLVLLAAGLTPKLSESDKSSDQNRDGQPHEQAGHAVL